MRKILDAWRPYQEESSRATEALTLREVISNVEVRCDFSRSADVSLMLANLEQKYDQCTNPTEEQERDAVRFFLNRHRELAKSAADPTGHV